MSLTTSEMTPADIAAVTNNGNGGFGGFGGDGAWWIIILFLFVFCGWGNGFGNNGGGSAMQSSLTRGDLCMDMNFNDLQNGVRNINDAVNLGFANLNSTICHQQYDTAMQTNAIQSAVNGGFAALNSTICQQQYDLASQLNAMNTTNMQNANALQVQIAQCCCDERAALENVRFTIAQEDCNTRNLIQATSTAMMQNANDNTRAILDKLTQQEIASKDAQIAAQTQKIFGLELSASQAAQNSYLISKLSPPTPVPAYPAASPCGLGNWAPSVLSNGFGYGGCGCCNG